MVYFRYRKTVVIGAIEIAIVGAVVILLLCSLHQKVCYDKILYKYYIWNKIFCIFWLFLAFARYIQVFLVSLGLKIADTFWFLLVYSVSFFYFLCVCVPF
ncbi:hypothetical protein C2G38_1398659 [Gigaspora rosea]|uniref:Uncharacterized protein n=1 Tax=Gigaspora rosea TaxID=44941 RepID=A0A397V831_9GLOM|nr:hypothetical protein C2G38_1398659 [Gigaspora rosea]